MAYIEWTKDLSVGIDVIDGQHKVLIEKLNILFEAMKTGKAKEVIVAVLDELLKYTDYHFSVEEKAFDKYGYERAKEQKTEHQFFIKRLNELRQKQGEGSLSVNVETMNFMIDWIKKHIAKEDRLYTDFFKDKKIV